MVEPIPAIQPGRIALLGSGETSPVGGQIYEILAASYSMPLQVAVLETPAGFELNAAAVAGRVVDFLTSRLQNFSPHVDSVAARKKNTPFSPDDPAILCPLVDSQLIFLGPGSPTYTVRQLQDSLAWSLVKARQRQGASLALASAAAIAASSWVLPVYEIYKVGEDPHWVRGLGLLEPFGFNLAIIPHWNNKDGGSELDTSRCFMGQSRFADLLTQLPADIPVLGLDELTGLILDFSTRTCQVIGRGSAHILQCGDERSFPAGSSFDFACLGSYTPLDDANIDIDPGAIAMLATEKIATPQPDDDVVRLLAARVEARKNQKWDEADRLRDAIAALGWQVLDTPDGAKLVRGR